MGSFENEGIHEGARRKILFVEGGAQSLDRPLYGILFPEVSVVSKEGCRDVEYAVRGLRDASDLHWISAWGIIDNDRRSAENIASLKEAGVWALAHYSVEALYYHHKIVARVAERQAKVTGDDHNVLLKDAVDAAIMAAKQNKRHLVECAVIRSVRQKIIEGMPRSHEDIETCERINVDIEVSTLRAEENAKFDQLVATSNWEGLLTGYPLRKSSAFDRIVSGIKMKDRFTYQKAVLRLLKDDSNAVAELRNLFGDLSAHISQ